MSEMPPMTPSGRSCRTGGGASVGGAQRRVRLDRSHGRSVRRTAVRGVLQDEPHVDLVRPIAYFVILVLAAACVNQLWSFLLFDSILEVARSMAGSQFEKLAPLIQRPGVLQLILTLVVTPLLALIALFIWSGLVHLALVLVGGANKGFTATLRVICYAQTTQLAVLIPFLGGIVGFFWRLVLEMIGLSEAHKTDVWKAAVAVLLPLVVCCLCIVAGAVAFGAAVVQALQNLK